MKAWSIFSPATCEIGREFLMTVSGNATSGSSLLRSMVLATAVIGVSIGCDRIEGLVLCVPSCRR